MPAIADPELPQLPTEPDPNDPVSSLGYEPATAAERQQEIDDWDSQQQPQPNVLDRTQDLKDQFDQTKDTVDKAKGYRDKYKDWRAARAEKSAAKKAAGKGAKEGLKEGVERQGAAAAKQGAQQVAKAGAKTAATTAAKAGATAATLGAEAATGPVGWVLGALTVLSLIGKPLWNLVKKSWKVPVYILAGLLLLLAVPFGLLGGTGSPQYPSTTYEKAQAATLLGEVNSADTPAAIDARLDQLGQSLNRIESEIDRTTADPAEAAEVRSGIANVKMTIKDLRATLTNPVKRKELSKQLNDQLIGLSKKYPKLFAAGGSCAETASYIASGAIQIRASIDAKLLPEGRLRNIDGRLIDANPRICNLLLYLVKNGYKIGAITLSNNHSKNVKRKDEKVVVSEHYLGRALDIAIINGEYCRGGGNSCAPSKNWDSITETVMTDLRTKKDELGIYDLWGPQPLSIDNTLLTPRRIDDHDNHLHISVQ